MLLRSLIKLVALAGIPLFLVLLIDVINPFNYYNRKVQKEYLIYSYGGVFSVAADYLKSYPQDQWREHFEKISQNFGYRTMLKPLHQYKGESETFENLSQGLHILAYSEDDEPNALLKRLDNTEWVLHLGFKEGRGDELQRDIKGPRYLVNSLLIDHPQSEWSMMVDRLNEQFSIDIVLYEMNELSLSDKQFHQLNAGETVIQHNGDESVFYWKLPDSDYCIKVGPISDTSFEVGIISVFLIFMLLIIAGGVSLWLYPVWRDLKHLDKAALNFGKGYLETRVKIKSGSIASRLGLSFNEMGNSIQKLIRTNQDLTNAVAHDLRTPLARLRFAFEMLENQDCTDEERKRYKTIVYNSMNGLDYLINQMLTYSRYNRVAKAENFSACYFANDVLDEVEEQQFSLTNIQINLMIDEQLKDLEMVVDKHALRRALTNLLTNAVKFATSNINVAFYQQEACFILSVEDDGPGINQSDIENIFQAFVQLDNSPRAESMGHGLGLAIVNQIAQWHKGKITAQSSENLGGAHFILQWPRTMNEKNIETKLSQTVP